MKRFLIAAFLGTAVLTMGVVASENKAAEDDTGSISGKQPFGQHEAKGGSSGSAPLITYHGGPVLTGTVPIYTIYYGGMGNFPVTTQPIIDTFLMGLGGTPQFDVNQSYCNVATTACPGGGASVSGLLGYDSSHVFFDAGSQGTTIKSNTVPKILAYALASTTSGHLPANPGAIYIVMTAPAINASGFCTSFCAYHSKSTAIVSGVTIHYAFVPEPTAKCTVCDGNFAVYGEKTTPNDDPGADEMVDSLVHEISETVSDPDINAWYTSNGSENGDLCNYNYSSSSLDTTTVNGNTVHFNASWGGLNFLIQRIWKNTPVPQGCAP